MSHERRGTEIPHEAHKEPGESRICVDNVCASAISKADRAHEMFTSHERWWTSAVVYHATRGARGAQVFPIELSIGDDVVDAFHDIPKDLQYLHCIL